MAQKEFDIGGLSALRFRVVFYLSSCKTRALIFETALSALESAHKSGMESNAETFSAILADRHSRLTADQKSLITAICLHVYADYQSWCEERTKDEEKLKELHAKKEPERKTSLTVQAPAKIPNHSKKSWHGGSGYTGRLQIGFAAPNGSESFRSDDEPRLGRVHWVKAITAGGFGPGHSLAELSGTKQPKSYPSVIPLEDLRVMQKDALLDLMDNATNPGNFLRAMLAYYRRPMYISLDNLGDVNSSCINNPENIRSMSRLDAVYRYMHKMDIHQIFSPIRATRFLVLCNDILAKVEIKKARSHDKISQEKCRNQRRELSAAADDIRFQLQDACHRSGITAVEMRMRIESDKRQRFSDTTAPVLKQTAEPS